MKLLISRDTNDVYTRFAVYDQYEQQLFEIAGKEGTAVKKIKAFTLDGKCAFEISATPEIGSTIGYNIVTPNSAFAVTIKLKASEMTLKIHGAKLFFSAVIDYIFKHTATYCKRKTVKFLCPYTFFIT